MISAIRLTFEKLFSDITEKHGLEKEFIYNNGGVKMQITQQREKEKLLAFVSGRIDTITAPKLEKLVLENLDGVTEFILDFKDMSYISSAGLRVLLKAQKLMNQQGSMKLTNVRKEVMEIFDVTGFSDILNIE